MRQVGEFLVSDGTVPDVSNIGRRRSALSRLGYVVDVRAQPQADLADPGWVSYVLTPDRRVLLGEAVASTAEEALRQALTDAESDAAE
jgi:hypothetical protein